jgi:DNA-binding MarR family transcriptional regulator
MITKFSIYPNMSIKSIDNFGPESLSKLRDFRSALLSVQQQLSLPQVTALLTIGLEPGLSVNELADRLDIPQQTASRHVAILTGRYQSPQHDQAISPLVEQRINFDDPRRRALSLTQDGLRLMHGFLQNAS